MFIINPYVFSVVPSFTNTYSMLFDGVDEYFSVGIGNNVGVGNVSSVSFSFWYKQNGGTGHIFGASQSSSARVGATINSNELRFFLNTNYGYKSSAITDTNWHHIAMVFNGAGSTDADKAKIYIDGSVQTLTFSGSMPATIGSITSSSFYLGRFTTDYVDGNLDEFRIYDYNLSGADVTAIYNSGSPKDDDLATPAIHYWRMGDGATWSGSDWTCPDIGTGTVYDAISVNMENGDRVTDTP